MIEYFKKMWKNYRLNNHKCEDNYDIIDSYTTSSTNSKSTCQWQVVIAKCNICGKRFDID
jgi:hypothetical protein